MEESTQRKAIRFQVIREDHTTQYGSQISIQAIVLDSEFNTPSCTLHTHHFLLPTRKLKYIYSKHF